MCPDEPVVDVLCQVVTLNESFEWSVVADYLFYGPVVSAVYLTIAIAVLAQVVGTLLGFLLYFLRRTRLAPLRWLANGYIWFFRGTPLLVQILLIYAAMPYLGLVQPLADINVFPALGYSRVPMDSFVAALIALSLNEGAYMAEIVRAGVDAVDPGQLEAGQSLGMTYRLAMRRIVLPQAARVIVPPFGNEFNNMLKNSSLASAIALLELVGTASEIGAASFTTLELYVVASFWYLVLTSVWALIQATIERRLNVSVVEPKAMDPWWQRLVGTGFSRWGRRGSA